MSDNRRDMPNWLAVWSYWRPFEDRTRCFACGRSAGSINGLERAHIHPRCEGGSDDVTNLHLLCHACHVESEFISGAAYYEWIWRRACRAGQLEPQTELVVHKILERRSTISERTRAALQRAKANGRVLGNRGNLAEAQAAGNEAMRRAAARFAANVLPIIYEMQADGITVTREIAAALNARGIATARGGAWHHSTVRYLLQRERG